MKGSRHENELQADQNKGVFENLIFFFVLEEKNDGRYKNNSYEDLGQEKIVQPREHVHEEILETEVEAFIGISKVDGQKAKHFLAG